MSYVTVNRPRRRITVAIYKGGVCVSEKEIDPDAKS